MEKQGCRGSQAAGSRGRKCLLLNCQRHLEQKELGAEVAKAQAEERGHPVEAELLLYVIHGVLHLCGYDDTDDESAAEMRVKERHYLQQAGLPDIVE